MFTTLNDLELKCYIERQIKYFITDDVYKDGMLTVSDVAIALKKCEKCFFHIKNPAYSDDKGNCFFSHLHADQYSTLLVFLSNYIWCERQDKTICDRLMYLNRVLHSFMMSYKASIPDIFWLAHPIGSIVGNAEYSDYLYISQNCTINTGEKEKDGSFTPKIGKYFAMGAGAILIGNNKIGNNCSIGAGAMLYNQSLEDNTIVVNNCGVMEIKKNNKLSLAQKLFR